MGLILTAGYTAFFLFLVSRSGFFQIDGIRPSTIKAAFFIKLLAGVSLGLVYTYYYTDRLTADTFKYFDDGALLFSLFRTDPVSYLKLLTGFGQVTNEMQTHVDKMTNWYDTFSPFNDNRTMIRFNSLLMFISMGHYYVHVVFISFLSFTGIVAITKAFIKFQPLLAREIFLVLMILPSTLFWCSGLLKDSLTLFILGLLIYHLSIYIRSSGTEKNSLFISLLMLVILMFTKFQAMVIITPVVVSAFLIRSVTSRPLLTIAGAGAVFTLLLIGFDYLLADKVILNLLHAKQEAFFSLAHEAEAGSLIKIPRMEPSIWGLIKTIPSGLFTGTFRPFITDTRNIMMLISGIENTVILLFAAYSIYNSRSKISEISIAGAISIYFALASFTLIGIMTPVLGALVRYKALALPFFVLFFLIIARENRSPVTRICNWLKL